MKHKQFYVEMGKLLFAIANVDGKIAKPEAKKIYEIVEKRLVPMEDEKDGFGSNVAYYTEIEFDYLDNEMVDTEDAYQSFVDFVEKNRAAFNEQLINACLQAVKEVAMVHYNVSAKEQTIIKRLEIQFNRIKKLSIVYTM